MNIHNKTPFRHQVMNPKKEKKKKKKKRDLGCGRSWRRWQILAKLHLEKTDRSSEKTKKERNKPVMILRPTVTELETDDDRA